MPQSSAIKKDLLQSSPWCEIGARAKHAINCELIAFHPEFGSVDDVLEYHQSTVLHHASHKHNAIIWLTAGQTAVLGFFASSIGLQCTIRRSATAPQSLLPCRWLQFAREEFVHRGVILQRLLNLISVEVVQLDERGNLILRLGFVVLLALLDLRSEA